MPAQVRLINELDSTFLQVSEGGSGIQTMQTSTFFLKAFILLLIIIILSLSLSLLLERERQKEIIHSPFHPQNVHKSQCWTRLKPGA